MRAGILLSVREKATRLPGKVLKPLGDVDTVTAFLLRRLKTSKRADVVLVATSDDPRDRVLCAIAGQEGVACFQGSQDDKLIRYRDAAHAHDLDFCIVVDGDDPFVSISHIDRIIDCAAQNAADLIVFDNLPLGATGFGLRTKALEEICNQRPEQNTEVWGTYFREDDRFECLDLHEDDPSLSRPEVRMTLDYPQDYEFFRQVADRLIAEKLDITFENIMGLIARQPRLAEINAGVQAAYEAHIKSST